MDISKELFALADEKYRLFTAKLIPTLSPEHFIGVSTPHLRSLAKKMLASGGRYPDKRTGKKAPCRRISLNYAALLRISNGVRPFFILIRSKL